MRTVVAEGVAELVTHDGNDQLLIIFAHRDAKYFAFEAATEDLPCDRLLVRDPSLRGWYNAGLPGFGATIEEIRDSIRDRVNLQRYRRTATLGSSMGGYAAVLFGALLGVDQVLAFNAQTMLNRIFPLSPPESVTLQCSDLGPAVAATRGTRFDLVIGEDDAADLCHAAHLTALPGVSVWTVPGSSHLLTEELNRCGELKPMLRRWLEGRRMELLAASPSAASLEKAKTVEQGVMAYLSSDYQRALPLLSDVLRGDKSHIGISLFVGMAAAAEGETEVAISALRTTLRHRPQWEHAQELLRRCLAGRPFNEPVDLSAPMQLDCANQEFEGVGQSLDAAVWDAMNVAMRETGQHSDTRAKVIDWGAQMTGIGGARLFWVRIKNQTMSHKHAK